MSSNNQTTNSSNPTNNNNQSANDGGIQMPPMSSRGAFRNYGTIIGPGILGPPQVNNRFPNTISQETLEAMHGMGVANIPVAPMSPHFPFTTANFLGPAGNYIRPQTMAALQQQQQFMAKRKLSQQQQLERSEEEIIRQQHMALQQEALGFAPRSPSAESDKSTSTKDSKKGDKSRAPKGFWTAEEDERLKIIVAAAKEKTQFLNWKQVAGQLDGRSAKQCRERFTEYLDPAIDNSPFTPQEDTLILKAQAQLGNKWKDIAELIKDKARTPTAVKVRWHYLRRRMKKTDALKQKQNILSMSQNAPSLSLPIAKTVEPPHVQTIPSYSPPQQQHHVMHQHIPSVATAPLPPPPKLQTGDIVGTIPINSVNNPKLNLPNGVVGIVYASLPGFPINQGYYMVPIPNNQLTPVMPPSNSSSYQSQAQLSQKHKVPVATKTPVSSHAPTNTDHIQPPVAALLALANAPVTAPITKTSNLPAGTALQTKQYNGVPSETSNTSESVKLATTQEDDEYSDSDDDYDDEEEEDDDDDYVDNSKSPKETKKRKVATV